MPQELAYMENARIIREGLKAAGMTVYGGDALYIWLKTPSGLSSWDFFDKHFNETNVVEVPPVPASTRAGKGSLIR